MKDQLRKQVARVRELRIKKVEEPGMSTSFISFTRHVLINTQTLSMAPRMLIFTMLTL